MLGFHPFLSHLIFSIPHFNDKERCSERVSNLPMVTQLASGRARIGPQNHDSTSVSVQLPAGKTLNQSGHGFIQAELGWKSHWGLMQREN